MFNVVPLQMHVDVCAADLLRRGKQTDYCSITSREVPALIDRIPTSETTSRCPRAVTVLSATSWLSTVDNTVVVCMPGTAPNRTRLPAAPETMDSRIVAWCQVKPSIVCGNRRLHVSYKAARSFVFALLLCHERLGAQ